MPTDRLPHPPGVGAGERGRGIGPAWIETLDGFLDPLGSAATGTAEGEWLIGVSSPWPPHLRAATVLEEAASGTEALALIRATTRRSVPR
ncbi:hypothetical protein ACFU6I_04480 [Streptomyces sp. NPDC057486]|uniref:hypothetical protein n=1 Tax=Streptomyces sp. NPDC057486 TaxID=3346145 RepID=UPI00368037EB